MKFAEILARLAHILGLAGNGDGNTTTAITTSGHFMGTSTPMIVDTSTLIQYKTTESPHTGSNKFLSSLSTYETSLDDHQKISTSSKPETSSNLSTGSPIPTVTGSGSPGTIQHIGSSESTPYPGESSKPTGETTQHTGETSKPTGETTQHTGETSKITGETTKQTGETTHPTGEPTKPTGETTHHTGEPTKPTGEPTHPTGGTTPGPTDKPSNGLSRGAVAGIVIGCLLVVAIITAAVVFVVKNRNSPEVQRLNV